MIKKISYENFKCFVDTEVEFKKLTLLSGMNSVGKSSVIQSIMLIKQAEEDYNGNVMKLNNKYVELGSSSDVIYRLADENIICINIDFEDGSSDRYKLSYSDSQADYLNILDSVTNSDYLKKTHFEYISAERIGPVSIYPKSSYEVYVNKSIGKQGEYTQHYLSVYGRKKIDNDLLIEYMKTHLEQDSIDLISVIQYWLNYISPGINIDIQEIPGIDVVDFKYSVLFGKHPERIKSKNVGFGVSYVLAILVAIIKAEIGETVIIENPEAHIHPMGQRVLGELIAIVANTGVNIIVESHSDHLLNGIRISVKNKLIDSNNVMLNFFVNKEEFIQPFIDNPVILSDGRMSHWPNGFFDEWDKSMDDLLFKGDKV